MSGVPSSAIIHCSTASISSAICGVRRVMLALALLPLPARMVFSTSGLTPACRPRMLVTRLRVCPASKATRTRSQASRVLSVPICRRIACSMIGCNSTACWTCSFWRTASRRKAAPVAETLKPSCLAIRSTSALTSRSTQIVTRSSRRFLLTFCDRATEMPDGRVRSPTERGTGWLEAWRTRSGAPLSCPTPRSGRPSVARYDCFEKISCIK